MTTVLLNLHNAGFYELKTAWCWRWAFVTWRRANHRRHHGMEESNTFAATAFISYGFFWLSLVTLIVLAKLGWARLDETAMAAYSPSGSVHCCHVCRHVAPEPRLASRFRPLAILFFLLAIGDFTA